MRKCQKKLKIENIDNEKCFCWLLGCQTLNPTRQRVWQQLIERLNKMLIARNHGQSVENATFYSLVGHLIPCTDSWKSSKLLGNQLSVSNQAKLKCRWTCHSNWHHIETLQQLNRTALCTTKDHQHQDIKSPFFMWFATL